MRRRPSITVSIPKSVWRIVNGVFYGVAFCMLLVYAIVLLSPRWPRPHPWLFGDWLINYQGGFVRRGLVGEVLLKLSTPTGIEVGILVAVLVMLLYLVFLRNAWTLSAGSSFTPLNAMLVFSPAFILFPVLDPQAAFRKEILFFAVLSALCARLADSRAKIPRYLPACAGLACAVLVLSHEMLIVYLPYAICPFILYDKGLGRVARRAALFMIPALFASALVIVLGRGNEQVVVDICHSLGGSAPVDCLFPSIAGGAITFLGKDMRYAYSFVQTVNGGCTLRTYAVCAVLSFMPLVLKIRSRQFRESLVGSKVGFWWMVCIGTALLASLPLLWIATDYGRIINIHVVCLSLLTLMATQERSDMPLGFRFTVWHVGVWLAVFLFIGSWRLSHIKASPEDAFVLYSAISHAIGQ